MALGARRARHDTMPEILPPGTGGQLGGTAGPSLQLADSLVLWQGCDLVGASGF